MASNLSHQGSRVPPAVPVFDAFSLACMAVAVLFAASAMFELLRIRDADAAGPGGLLVLVGGIVGAMALLSVHAMQRALQADRRAASFQSALAQRALQMQIASVEPPPVPSISMVRKVDAKRVDAVSEAIDTPRNRADGGGRFSQRSSDLHWGGFNGHPFADGFPFGRADAGSAARLPVEPVSSELVQALACLEQAEQMLRQRNRRDRPVETPPRVDAVQTAELV